MFETKKTLIVIYKDELLMNQLKKMIETPDDNEQEIVGTKDGSINIISWTEDVWFANKKAGNIQGKILFLGDIKGTESLIPVIDVKFKKYGVKFGWAGNQAVLYAEPKALTSRKTYDAFLEKLSVLPIPKFLKKMPNHNSEKFSQSNGSSVDFIKQTPSTIGRKFKTPEILRVTQKALSARADTIGKISNQVVSKSEEVFRNKSLMKRQMLFYGLVNLYQNGLEEFMNL